MAAGAAQHPSHRHPRHWYVVDVGPPVCDRWRRRPPHRRRPHRRRRRWRWRRRRPRPVCPPLCPFVRCSVVAGSLPPLASWHLDVVGLFFLAGGVPWARRVGRAVHPPSLGTGCHCRAVEATATDPTRVRRGVPPSIPFLPHPPRPLTFGLPPVFPPFSLSPLFFSHSPSPPPTRQVYHRRRRCGRRRPHPRRRWRLRLRPRRLGVRRLGRRPRVPPPRRGRCCRRARGDNGHGRGGPRLPHGGLAAAAVGAAGRRTARAHGYDGKGGGAGGAGCTRGG